jgi:hypothetical protein
LRPPLAKYVAELESNKAAGAAAEGAERRAVSNVTGTIS